MKKITLGIDGMSCAACSNTIEKHLNRQEGIKQATVNLVMANATIEFDENVLSQKQIENFIKQVGFKSTGIYKVQDEDKKIKSQKIRLIIFGVLAVIVLYVSMGSMIGLLMPPFLDMHSNGIVYASVLFALIVPFLIYGLDVFISGIKKLLHRSPNMDTLVSIGVFASLGYSIFSFVMIASGHHAYVESLYFESCAIIIYFIKLGRFIDKASKNKTKQAIKDLVQITPDTAYIKRDDQIKQVSIDEIKQGDIVVCHAGEKIAVDGKIVSGYAHLDESFITGESKPNGKGVQKNVIAGSINLDGYIEYRAEKIGKDSTVSEIVRLVVEASNSKMPIAKLADKVCGIFVPSVLAIAFIAFFVYLCIGQGFNRALLTFVTVLVVACPCALGLATPLAVVISEGICAKNGILVKKSQTLELANKINVVVFDKTGTLTYGKLKISKILNFSNINDGELLKLACSLESLSSHPIASAFNEKHTELYTAKNVEILNGLGIVGNIKDKQIVLGNAKILDKYKIANDYITEEESLAQFGNSIVYMAIDKKIVALFGVNDTIKVNAKDVIKELHDRKIEVIMLTGDNEKTANIFAKELGIDKVFANVMPSEKAEIIRQIKRENKVVLMCGDGINDSPALAIADIGVSVNNGTDIAMNSSDVVLMADNLNKILDLCSISKRTVSNIKQNLFWAFFYNSLMIPLSLGVFRFAGVVISPMFAGIAMTLSSLTVVFNALRLKLLKLNKKEN